MKIYVSFFPKVMKTHHHCLLTRHGPFHFLFDGAAPVEWCQSWWTCANMRDREPLSLHITDHISTLRLYTIRPAWKNSDRLHLSSTGFIPCPPITRIPTHQPTDGANTTQIQPLTTPTSAHAFSFHFTSDTIRQLCGSVTGPIGHRGDPHSTYAHLS